MSAILYFLEAYSRKPFFSDFKDPKMLFKRFARTNIILLNRYRNQVFIIIMRCFVLIIYNRVGHSYRYKKMFVIFIHNNK